MKVVFHREFTKRYKKLNKRQQQRFRERLAAFMKNPLDRSLRNHPLRGNYGGYRSINITGDWRVIYEEVGDTALFVIIGTHSELYE